MNSPWGEFVIAVNCWWWIFHQWIAGGEFAGYQLQQWHIIVLLKGSVCAGLSSFQENVLCLMFLGPSVCSTVDEVLQIITNFKNGCLIFPFNQTLMIWPSTVLQRNTHKYIMCIIHWLYLKTFHFNFYNDLIQLNY